ncbi:hypothetical protein RH915_10295 [Serpentinicella sp. ANB-PHB4]|uniref:hypothetical protein n=1 Tax=Serpentinicella sp. ANB-PHB4 TaxID=3074076 RepID=UPI002857CC51|nr:hypothetical protein [Serpentinicella sp. ANB-PHB4]MDR5659879.1 hypothetical protein [Serpentinicella sp. ANB-PHB4]
MQNKIKLGNYIFTDNLMELYNDIMSLNSHRALDIRIAAEEELPDIVAGRCNIDLFNNTSTILLKDYSLDEFTISHELLHEYLFRNGYLVTCTLGLNEGVEFIAGYIDDIIAHKLILEEQNKRGFSSNIESKGYMEFLCSNLADTNNFEKDIFQILRMTEFMYVYDKYKNEYLDYLKQNSFINYGYACSILEVIIKNNIRTPFEGRRALIRAFKQVENIAKEYGIDALGFDLLILVPMIVSEHQLEQVAFTVLEFRKDAITIEDSDKISTLHLRSDGQCCWFIENYADEIEGVINNMLLKDFLKEYNIAFAIR